MLEKQEALLKSGKSMADIIKEAAGDCTSIGAAAFLKLGQRRTGGGLNSPNGREGQVLMLPFGPKLAAFVVEMPKVGNGPEWYKLICEDADGYLVGIPINRFCESYTADKRDEGDELPKPTPVNTESDLTRYFAGPNDAVCLQNLCDHLNGKAIKIDKIYTETRILVDGTTARGRRWQYSQVPDDEQPDFTQSLLWCLLNWEEAKKQLTPEQQATVLETAEKAGIDTAEATKPNKPANK